MTPINTDYWVWIVWMVSWWAAAFWRSRTAASPKLGLLHLTRLIALIGFPVLFWSRGVTETYDPTLPFWVPPPWAQWALVALTVLSFGFCWWARIALGRLWSASVMRKADHRIIDTGPYAVVRHPIYTGLIAAGFFMAALKGTWPAVAGAALIAIGFWATAIREERFLSEELGADAYAAYRRRVPALIPFGPH